MIIVADTTPLSELAKVGRLELLRDIFGTVIIPQEVYDEVNDSQTQQMSVNVGFRSSTQPTCFRIFRLKRQVLGVQGQGEL
ncbi:hypothetical protein [Scytonema sp. NUACC26]|uniref:hypothetical protein n=1 Tax=Scytonema sp. NUACC26 TaxID=3140176 RepID=UPI0034DCAACF